MLVKLIIILFLAVILYALGSGLYYLVRDRSSKRLVEALTWRIALSLGLFILLFIAYALGWIKPHGI